MLLPGVVFLFVCLTQPELLKAVSSVSALLCIAAIGGLATMRLSRRGDGKEGKFNGFQSISVAFDGFRLILTDL